MCSAPGQSQRRSSAAGQWEVATEKRYFWQLIRDTREIHFLFSILKLFRKYLDFFRSVFDYWLCWLMKLLINFNYTSVKVITQYIILNKRYKKKSVIKLKIIQKIILRYLVAIIDFWHNQGFFILFFINSWFCVSKKLLSFLRSCLREIIPQINKHQESHASLCLYSSFFKKSHFGTYCFDLHFCITCPIKCVLARKCDNK